MSTIANQTNYLIYLGNVFSHDKQTVLQAIHRHKLNFCEKLKLNVKPVEGGILKQLKNTFRTCSHDSQAYITVTNLGFYPTKDCQYGSIPQII